MGLIFVMLLRVDAGGTKGAEDRSRLTCAASDTVTVVSELRIVGNLGFCAAWLGWPFPPSDSKLLAMCSFPDSSESISGVTTGRRLGRRLLL